MDEGYNNMSNKVWFHADDYGVTQQQSSVILECYEKGALNSISVLPNTSNVNDALLLLNEIDTDKKIRRVLHLNFVEGKPLSEIEKIPMLVDEQGFFDKSFINFVKWNYLKKSTNRIRLKEQIKAEIRAQLDAVTCNCNFEITAIDSHQHYHMVPIIFDSLMEVLSEKKYEKLDIRQIRIPVDPIYPVMHNFSMLKRIPAINLVKWLILKIYAKRNKNILKKMGIEVPVFFGIFYTCEMKVEVVSELLHLYKAYASKKNADLELMFHPGNLSAKHELLDTRRDELADFYMSDNRVYEAECLKILAKS